jgi:two-component system phosphate regulon sensor histidine kinase PhoR
VDDNGPGVTDEERDVIFERFRRGDSHRARSRSSAGGYGLGLSISRKIAEREGGSLELGGSSLGGASFIMTLPKAELKGSEEK